MQKSDSINELAGALVKFQSEVGAIKKDAQNPFFKSAYASLENIISTATPILKKHELSFAQFPDGDGLTTILAHSSGQFMEATFRMSPKDNSPQAQGSAISYARRYALSAVLGLATEDDDDGNAASAPAKAPVAPKTAPTKRANPPVYKSPAARELDAKTRIISLVNKLNDGAIPNDLGESKEARAKYYGDEVQRLTKQSLEIANVDGLEAIGDELGKLFDSRK